MNNNTYLDRLFKLLEDRRHLLVLEHENYSSLVNFFIGYELGLFQDKGANPHLLHFNNWLEEKEGKRFNLTWYSYIYQKANKDEKRAIEMLLQYMKEFLFSLKSTHEH